MTTLNSSAQDFGSSYYRDNYRHYVRQNPEAKMAFYSKLVTDNTGHISRGRILDIGCAFGRFLDHMDPQWYRVGMDISEFAISEASRRIRSVDFLVGSCESIPVRGGFDAVVAFDVIEHVPKLESLVAWIGQHLHPHGVFVFVVPVYDGPLGGIVRRLDHDPTHVHKCSRSFWLQWASKHFRLVSWQGVFRYCFPFGPYVSFSTSSFRHVAPAIAVVARRRR